MILLDGRELSKKRLEKLAQEIAENGRKEKAKAKLAVIRVGDDPASEVYVSKKIEACRKAGILSAEIHMPASSSHADVLKQVQSLNQDASVHGILVQLPLPSQVNTEEILETVDPRKDVDGFHPLNLGYLASQRPVFVPCTPLGIMNLLQEYKISLNGKRAVVMGRSRIVGRPLSLLLDFAGATVTVVHSKTPDPEMITKQADVLVAAIGKPNFVGEKFIKPGAVIVDVGINRLPSGQLVGDVDFEKVKSIASAITPVPGGVGPMTICTLLENTWRSFLAFRSAQF